ncbi:ABC transporter permease [Clostridium aminobutyricum]|uniref:ABC transporter permease n=1 Tax=Clostridium aminobutyricum TaxID=33953 RepID=A0A939IGI2_CLOAM|nr:ABC transporter permease [Clostridium aminobutyricum]MBN7773350.1 ABC transporter permease [Clostridium aminobutyricum]
MIPFKLEKVKSLFVILIFFIVWEAVTRLGIVDSMLLPSFSEVLVSTWQLFAEGVLWPHLSLSLVRAAAGFAIAVVIAIPLGILMGGLSKNVQMATEPVVELFSQVNPFILYHLILIFMGIGEWTKITIIAWTCIWPLLFSTISGVYHIDAAHIKSAKTFQLNRWQMAVKVLLPGAVPQIMYGVRLSASYSFFMLIAAEMMGAESGLGFFIILSQRYYKITWVYAAVLMITVLGVLMDWVITMVERKFLRAYVQEEVND